MSTTEVIQAEIRKTELNIQALSGVLAGLQFALSKINPPPIEEGVSPDDRAPAPAAFPA